MINLLDFPAKPFMVSDFQRQLIEDSIEQKTIRQDIEQAHKNMGEENIRLLALVLNFGKARFEKFAKSGQVEAGALVSGAFYTGAFASYLAFSLDCDFSLPEINPLVIAKSFDEPASMENSEWHFGIVGDLNLFSVIKSIGKVVPQTIESEQALYSGAGLVSYLLNDHVSRFN